MIYRVYTIPPASTTKDHIQAVTGKNTATLSAVPQGQNHLSTCGEQGAICEGNVQWTEVRGQRSGNNFAKSVLSINHVGSRG